MGAGLRDYKDQSEEIDLKTGGLNVSTHLVEHHKNEDVFEQVKRKRSFHLSKSIAISFFRQWIC